MGGNRGCQGGDQAGKTASDPACGHPCQTELRWVMTLLHSSIWNQDRQRVVAGLVPPAMLEGEPRERPPLCAKKRTEY